MPVNQEDSNLESSHGSFMLLISSQAARRSRSSFQLKMLCLPVMRLQSSSMASSSSGVYACTVLATPCTALLRSLDTVIQFSARLLHLRTHITLGRRDGVALGKRH